MQNNNTNRGGKRLGAGRPSKEPTVVLTFRVPEKRKKEYHDRITSLIQELKKTAE